MMEHIIECMNYVKAYDNEIHMELLVSGADTLIPRKIYTQDRILYDGDWEYDFEDRTIKILSPVDDGTPFLIHYGAVFAMDDETWKDFKSEYYDMFRSVFLQDAE